MQAKPWAFVVVVSMVLMLSAAVRAEARPVLQVIGVKVAAKDMETYLDKVKKLQAVSQRLGLPGPRVWRATLAGTDAGTVFIAMEHASLTAFADDVAKLQADFEWQKGLKDLDKSGIRTILSNSLLEEVTP
jgi:hypothetical protein